MPTSAATPLTIAAVTFTPPPGDSLDNPQGVAAADGVVDVSNSADNVVASIDGIAATLDQPTALARDKAGDLFIADTEENVVREITPDGIIHLIAGNGTEGDRGDGPAGHAELDSPQGVAVNAKGDVFIADTYNNVVREVTPWGFISTYAGDGNPGYRGDGGPAAPAELSSPTGLAVDALGNLYIADSGNNVIRRVSTNGVITTVAGEVAADQSSGGLGGSSGDGGPATQARLNSPQGIAIDQAGDLYIADTSNSKLRVVTGFPVATTTAGGPVAPAPPTPPRHVHH